MAILPPSDIVLGATLAVDPEKHRLAVERLRQLGGTRAAMLPERASAKRDAAQPAAPPPSAGGAAIIRPAKTTADAFGQLEAFVLQSFIQSMLPKNATHVFGKGMAGEMWKSLLAEKLAGEMARSGQVGLAERLATGRVEAAAANFRPESARLPSAPVASSTSVMRALSNLGGQSLDANPVAAALAMQRPKAAKRS